jgi:hypothetical protein
MGCVDAVEVCEVGAIALDRCGIAADRGDCLIQLELTELEVKAYRHPPGGQVQHRLVAGTGGETAGIRGLFPSWADGDLPLRLLARQGAPRPLLAVAFDPSAPHAGAGDARSRR